MKFDLIRLRNNIVKSIPIDLNYTFSEEDLSGTDLLKLENVKIEGEFFKNSLGDIELIVDVEGIMVMPCAITLKPVNYPFSLEISGELHQLVEEFDENQKNFLNTIDIFQIIWENILMEIPMRVISEDAEYSDIKLSGDGWKFVTEDEPSNPFSELMDYLDDSEVR